MKRFWSKVWTFLMEPTTASHYRFLAIWVAVYAIVADSLDGWAYAFLLVLLSISRTERKTDLTLTTVNKPIDREDLDLIIEQVEKRHTERLMSNPFYYSTGSGPS